VGGWAVSPWAGGRWNPESRIALRAKSGSNILPGLSNAIATKSFENLPYLRID
jgi:hypothetical protein